MTQGRRVGELLKAAGLITNDQLLDALREHERSGLTARGVIQDQGHTGQAAARCPVLILVGADDVYTPVSDAEAIGRLVPHAELCVIEGAGHLPGAEQPERFNEALLHFLRTQVAADPA